MKTFTLNALTVLGLLALSNPANALDLSKCDQIKSGGTLNYNKGYIFFDVWNNGGPATDYMNNFWVVYGDNETGWKPRETSAKNWNFIDPGEKFAWTDDLKKMDYAIPANTSVKIFETTSHWRIAKLGSDATGTPQDFDFALMYIKSYDATNTPKDFSDDVEQSTCVFYGIK